MVLFMSDYLTSVWVIRCTLQIYNIKIFKTLKATAPTVLTQFQPNFVKHGNPGDIHAITFSGDLPNLINGAL